MEQLDTFDSNEVIELPTQTDAPSGESVGDSSGLDTFDSDEVKEVEDGAGLSDRQTDQLEDKEDEPKEEKPAKEEQDKKDDAEKSEKEEKTGDEDSKEEAKQSIPRGKSIRVKDHEGNTSDLSLDSTVKLKVNGKNEIVTLQELRDNYSGKVAYDEKFSNLQEEKEELEISSKRFEGERNELIGHIQHIAKILDDPDASPFEALNYLVDMSGRNVLDFNKKVFAHLSEEVRNLDGMDDVERELYWNRKELDAIRSNQSAKEEKELALKTQREREQAINQLRESNGVTEKDFVESHRELEELGYSKDQITPEAIVNYAVMKPHYEGAEEVVKEYEDDLSDDQINTLISEVAKTLKSYPQISKEKALEVSLDLLGWGYEREQDFKHLNEKAGQVIDEKPKKFGGYKYGQQNKDELDMFDEF